MIILKDYESIKHTHYSSEKKEHSLSWHEMINHKALSRVGSWSWDSLISFYNAVDLDLWLYQYKRYLKVKENE